MNIIDKFLNIIAPESCLGCGQEDALLCYGCYALNDELGSICFVCQKATTSHFPCDEHTGRYAPDAVFMLQKYDGLVKDYLKAYKFNYKRSAGFEIANFMNDYLPYFDDTVIVTWVPTAPIRMRVKGFDHSKLIAKELATKRSLRSMNLIARKKSTMLHLLDKKERTQEIKKIYAVNASTRIKGATFLLVDDIITTGATIAECSRQLKKAGAKQVFVVALAKTF